MATYLYMQPVTRYVLAGASTTFSTTAMDDASVKTSLPGEVTYTVAGGVGSVSDDQFHAGSSTGPVSVYAQSGSATGEMQLMVVGAITSATIFERQGNLLGIGQGRREHRSGRYRIL
ncbi:MAG: hypothetical protein ACLUB2_00855 [Butyricicoccus pullicaecorum]